MPLKQLQIAGTRGTYTRGDDSGSRSDFPYFYNGFFEKISASEAEARKFAYCIRPGLSEQFNAQALANNYKIQGVITNPAKTTLFVYANNGSANKVYSVTASATTDKGAAPAAAGNWTYTGPVVFTMLDGISYGANVYYAVTDFTKGAVVDASGNWTEITDADFTGLSKCSNIIGLDGYLFIATTNNRIYNSNLNAATSWISTSFLTAADTPGSIMWLSKIRNYLIAFKEHSIEFFEDLGNPTPGSPLEARKQLNRNIGCINRSTIQEVSDGIIFAGVAATSGGPKIYKIKRDTLELEVISDRFVEQCLGASGYVSATTYSCDSTASATFAGQSQVFNMNAKEFYLVNLIDPGGSSKVTQVWDNDLKLWTGWASSIGTSNVGDTYGFTGSQAQMVSITNVGVFPIFVDNSSSGASAPPRFLMMHDQAYTDVAASGAFNSYTLAWTSDIYDFGSRGRKFMDSFELFYTINAGATPNASSTDTVTLLYRDWDYIDASGYTASKTLKVDSGSRLRAYATQLGQFRRRNFNIVYNNTNKTNFRMWGIEVRINEGETDQDS